MILVVYAAFVSGISSSKNRDPHFFTALRGVGSCVPEKAGRAGLIGHIRTTYVRLNSVLSSLFHPLGCLGRRFYSV